MKEEKTAYINLPAGQGCSLAEGRAAFERVFSYQRAPALRGIHHAFSAAIMPGIFYQ